MKRSSRTELDWTFRSKLYNREINITKSKAKISNLVCKVGSTFRFCRKLVYECLN